MYPRAHSRPGVAMEEAIRAFVKSRSERRDLSKGQRAMGHALLFPEGAKLKRKGSSSVSEDQGFSAARLSQARTVLSYSRDLALAVRDGTEKLDDAFAKSHASRAIRRMLTSRRYDNKRSLTTFTRTSSIGK